MATKAEGTMKAMHSPIYAAIASAALATLMEQTDTTEFSFNTKEELPDKVMTVDHDVETGKVTISTRPRQWGDE